MDEAAEKRSEAARKAWVTRKANEAKQAENYGEERCQELLAEAKAELDDAERKYKATEYLVDQFRRLKEETKKPATVAILALALFLMPAEAQVSLEFEEEYPLSWQVAYEATVFMANHHLPDNPALNAEVTRELRRTVVTMFEHGWIARASVERCGRRSSDRRCAEVLRRELRDSGF